jgi:hypothetical protein
MLKDMQHKNKEQGTDKQKNEEQGITNKEL